MTTFRTLDDVNAEADFRSRAFTTVVFARALAATGSRADAVRFAEERYGPTSSHVTRIKAAVTPATTGGVLDSTRLTDAFLELTRCRSALGRLSGTRLVPINTRVPIVSTGTIAAWFMQGGPIPATAMAFDLDVLPPTTIATILGESRELMRSLSPEASRLLERDLDRAVVDMEDTLLDDQAAVALKRPAGLLYGLSPIALSSPATLAEDVEALFGSVRDANADAPYFIASPRGGMYLSMATDTNGGKLFPDARAVDGGSLGGVPLLIAKAAGANLICVDAAAIAVADGGLEISVSENAAIQMDNAPSAGPQNVVSGFMTDTTFLRIIRTLHWVLGHADGAAFLELPLGSPA